MYAVITRKAQLRGQPNSLYFEYDVWDSLEAKNAGVAPDHESHVIQRNWTGQRIVTRADGWMKTASGLWIDPEKLILPDAPQYKWEYEAYSMDVEAECRSLIEGALRSIARRNVAPRPDRRIRYEATQLGKLAGLREFAIPEQRPMAPRSLSGAVLDLQVGAGADDAFEGTTGIVNLTGVGINVDNTAEHGGFRFVGTIPVDATSILARLGFYMQASYLDMPQHQIRGHAAKAPVTFVGGTGGDVGNRARTTAIHQWNSTDLGAASHEYWEWGAAAAGVGQGTDIGDIIAENVAAFGELTALVFIEEQHTLDSARDLGADAWDYNPANAAKLHIEYTAGGGALTKSLADSITVTEAIAKAIGYKPSDSLALADALGNAPDLAKSDTVAIADAEVKDSGVAKADTVAIADSETRVATFSRAPSDSLAIADALSLGPSIVQADIIALAESIVKAPGLVKADTVALAEALVKAIGSGLADTVSLSDATTKAVGQALADMVALVDLISKGVAFPLADVLSVLDAISKEPRPVKTDTITVTDSSIRGIGPRPTDTVNITDAVSGFDMIKALADRLSLRSEPVRIVDYVRAVSDSVAIADLISKAFGLPLADAQAVADSISKAPSKPLADSVAIIEAVARVVAFTRAPADTVVITDATYRALDRILAIYLVGLMTGLGIVGLSSTGLIIATAIHTQFKITTKIHTQYQIRVKVAGG